MRLACTKRTQRAQHPRLQRPHQPPRGPPPAPLRPPRTVREWRPRPRGWRPRRRQASPRRLQWWPRRQQRQKSPRRRQAAESRVRPPEEALSSSRCPRPTFSSSPQIGPRRRPPGVSSEAGRGNRPPPKYRARPVAKKSSLRARERPVRQPLAPPVATAGLPGHRSVALPLVPARPRAPGSDLPLR